MLTLKALAHRMCWVSVVLRAPSILMPFFLLIGCSSSVATKPDASLNHAKEISAVAALKHVDLRGWEFVAHRLVKDGVPVEAVKAVFANEKFPKFTFIPFKLSPRETSEMYASMTANERLDRAQSYLDKYKREFSLAETKFGVNRFVIAAIISVETNWGSFTGNEIVLHRLARIVSTGEPHNLNLNYKKFNSEDSTITFAQAEARARYLFDIFYPQILALFRRYNANPVEILNLKGSSAGAFGLPQFLPKSLEDFGVDGNGDKIVDLFVPEDAIFSVANFLKSHGWKHFLKPEEKLAVLWHYNRSTAYGRAVIRVSLSLQNRFMSLDT